MEQHPPVCDYEGSDYKTRFWESGERDYEDRVERVALRRLMPPTGKTLIEIGAGFGRLADEYIGYEKVVLFDYSRTLLREAQAHLGDDPVSFMWPEIGTVCHLCQVCLKPLCRYEHCIMRPMCRLFSPSSSAFPSPKLPIYWNLPASIT